MGVRGPSALSRTLVGSVLAAIGVGPLIADFAYGPTAEQHIHNPNWPPHAKFHDAQYIVMTPLVSAVGLRTLLQRRRRRARTPPPGRGPRLGGLAGDVGRLAPPRHRSD